MTPAWLNSHLHDPNLVVLDIRSAIDGSKPETFAQGHIPGAVHSDYDQGGWRVTVHNVPFMLPSLLEIQNLIGNLGIDENTHVVVVPAGVSYTDFGSAARVYWTLKVAGVPDVSILDGGIAAWKQASLPFERGENQPTPKTLFVDGDEKSLAKLADVEKIVRAGGATLVDARPAVFLHRRGTSAEGRRLWPHTGRDRCGQRRVLRRKDQPLEADGGDLRRWPHGFRPGRW